MKVAIISGAIHGFLAVALGAFGAHALEAVLNEYSSGIWDTAVQYQMFHATALLVIGVLMSSKLLGNVKQLKWATIGILGAITPIGGVLFLLGWIFIIVSVSKHAN